MGIEFKVQPHSVTPGAEAVEIWMDGKMVACMYGGLGKNVRGELREAVVVVSKYFEDYCYYTDGGAPGKLTITLDLRQ
jgi:hypothetical protein